MGKLKDKWNENKFSIYDSEEKTALKIIDNINKFNSVIADEVDHKTDINGNHLGSWQGLDKPTMSNEGLKATVDKIYEEKLPHIESDLMVKRDIFTKIKSIDLDTTNEDYKIGLDNLKEEVKQAIIGSTTINSEVADKSVNANKLAENVLGSEYEGVIKFIKDNIYSTLVTLDDLETFNIELIRYENDQLKYNKNETGTFGAVMVKNKSFNCFEFKAIDNQERYIAFAKNENEIYTINTGFLSSSSKGEIRICNIGTNEFTLLKTVEFSRDINFNNKIELSFDKELKIITLRNENNGIFETICTFKYNEFVNDDYLQLGFVTTNVLWTICYEKLRIQNKRYNYKEYVKSIEDKIDNLENIRFNNKVYCSIGDSITWQDSKVYEYNGQIAKGYQSIVKDQLGVVVNNVGKSGYTLLNMLSDYKNVTEYRNTINESNIITVFAGTNDYQLNTSLGEVNSYNENTFCGGMNIFIRELINNNPYKPILFIGTPQRRGYKKIGENEYSTQQTNDLNLTLKDYVDKMEEICLINGIPFLNLYKTSGFNKYNIDLVTRDGLHPNDYGYEKLGYKISDFIKTNC